MARHPEPISNLGLRGHAPADHGQRGVAAVPGVPRPLSRPRDARPSTGAERARRVVGPGILRPRAQPPPSRSGGPAAARRPAAGRPRGPSVPARVRRVHRGRRRVDGLRAAHPRGGSQRDARALAGVRHSRDGRYLRASRRGSTPRRGSVGPQAPGRRDGRAHGSRSVGLPAPSSRLSEVSDRRDVHRGPAWAHRPVSAPRRTPGDLEGLRRRGVPDPGGSCAPRAKVGAPSPGAVAIPIRGGSVAGRGCAEAPERARRDRPAPGLEGETGCDAAHNRPPPSRDLGLPCRLGPGAGGRDPKCAVVSLVHGSSARRRRHSDADPEDRPRVRLPTAARPAYPV